MAVLRVGVAKSGGEREIFLKDPIRGPGHTTIFAHEPHPMCTRVTYPLLSLHHIKNLQARPRQTIIEVTVPKHCVLESVVGTSIFQRRGVYMFMERCVCVCVRVMMMMMMNACIYAWVCMYVYAWTNGLSKTCTGVIIERAWLLMLVSGSSACCNESTSSIPKGQNSAIAFASWCHECCTRGYLIWVWRSRLELPHA